MFRNYQFYKSIKGAARKKSSQSHQINHIKLMTLLLGLVLSLGLTVQAMAQGGARGAIAGSIKDPSGAAVPNAKVEITNKQTGVIERAVTTSSDGSFSAPLLPIGMYRVVITASGFAKAEIEDVKVNVTETSTIPITLKVGAVTEAVTIELSLSVGAIFRGEQ
jgi:hypothetical protein